MAAPRSYAAIRRAVAEIMQESERGLDNSAVREALESLLGVRSAYGKQRALDYHTPRQPSPRMRDLMANSEVRRRMLNVIEDGLADNKRAAKFYDTRPIRAIWDNELGDQEGPAAFEQYMGINAALSPQARIPEQIKRANHVYASVRAGEGVPMWLPAGYGHFLYGSLQKKLANNVLRQGLNPRTGPKTASFRENLLGNLHNDVATIDKHATALPSIFSADPRWLKNGSEPVQYHNQDFVPRHGYESGEVTLDDAMEQPNWWGGRPRDNEYRGFVKMYGDLGREFGMAPAPTQAAAWRGGADITGVESPDAPMVTLFINRVMELASKHGMSVRDAAIRVVRGDPKFLALAGSPILAQMLANTTASRRQGV